MRLYQRIGQVTSALPLTILQTNEKNLLITAVGNHSFSMIDLNTMKIILKTQQIAESIVDLTAADDESIYTVLKSDSTTKIVKW